MKKFDSINDKSSDDKAMDDGDSFKPKLYAVRNISSISETMDSSSHQKPTSDSRALRDKQVVGMTSALEQDTNGGKPDTVEEAELKARLNVASNPFYLALTGNYAGFKVFFFYLITIDTIFTCSLTVGMTLYWYFVHNESNELGSWSAGGLSWSLVGFAVVLPMSRSISFAFKRREQALVRIAEFRSFAYHTYLAHSVWEWGNNNTGRESSKVDWINHTDNVLTQLIGIGDELCRFLTLPTSTNTRHRIMASGHDEARQIMQVSYRLFDSYATRRMLKLTLLVEDMRAEGLAATECSRIRQYERKLGETLEHLRQIKMYRTPQALRSFARIFTVFLPAFYAPTFAQLAMEIGSLTIGILMALITTLSLTALFESIQVLEDPFVAFVTLDGIDVREELEVLHYQQLINARGMIFPDAKPYSDQNLAALTPDNSNDVTIEDELGGSSAALRRVSETLPGGRRESLILSDVISAFKSKVNDHDGMKRTSAFDMPAAGTSILGKGNAGAPDEDGTKRELSAKWSLVRSNMNTLAFNRNNAD